jgi:hypothetical protein
MAIDSFTVSAPVQFGNVAEQDSASEAGLRPWEDLLAEQDLIAEQDLMFGHASFIGQGSMIEQEAAVEPNSIIEQEPDIEQSQPISHGPGPSQNPWEHALQTLYSPRALAGGVFAMLRSHLSAQARSKRYSDGQRGVNIRTSFMLGVDSGDIFDLDMCVDEDGIVEETLQGPREEADRFWEKLERRLWF